MSAVLEARGINKSFFGQKVVDDFDFKLEKGSIHALLGHNGAGKSTFLKIVSGVHKRDSGTILLDGKEVEFASPREAMDAGIQMVYQELDLIPYLDGAENIFLGQKRFHNRLGLINAGKRLEAAEKIIEPFDIDIDLTRQVSKLNISKQQIVALAKAISTKAKVLILDEPTSTLNDNEVQKLFHILRLITEGGTAVILITHRLEEVFQIADEITVMRDGRHIFTKAASEVTTDQIIENLTNSGEGTKHFEKIGIRDKREYGKTVISCKNLTLPGVFKDISFEIKQSQVLGITGLIGCGSNEVAGTVFGEYSGHFEEMVVDGTGITKLSPVQMRKMGVAYVPDDRKVKGLNMIGSVVANNSLTYYDNLGKAGFINEKPEIEQCEKMVRKFGVKVKSLHQAARSLSGGNQQKVVLSKWLQRELKLLVLSEPTRGIDATAKNEIHKMIHGLADAGMAILVVSSEIEEIEELCDEVLVLFEGKQMGLYDIRNTDKPTIMKAMYGEAEAL